MQIVRRRGWEIAERFVTPEHIALNRRGLLGAGLLGSILPMAARAEYPAGRAVTEEKYATTYNNYYEFGESKNIWKGAQKLPQHPWTVEFAGMVKEPRKVAIEDLLKQIPQEERIYRHRCVEAWAMTVPWTGFALSKLVAVAEPLGSAKYVVF